MDEINASDRLNMLLRAKCKSIRLGSFSPEAVGRCNYFHDEGGTHLFYMAYAGVILCSAPE